ncbi:unnamed protein product [Spodoptera exigua]|nr:unnamed protein product [Spodoptera exigua]
MDDLYQPDEDIVFLVRVTANEQTDYLMITTDNGHRNLICEECVSKLRDAEAFKMRILDIQEAMRKSVGWECIAADLSKKFEDNNNAIYDCNLDLSDTVEDSDFHWENFTDTEKGQNHLVISLNQDKFDSKAIQIKMFQETSNVIKNTTNDIGFSKNDGLKSSNNLKLKTKRSVKNSNVTVSKENLQIPTENDDSKNHLTDALINDEDYSNDTYAKLIDLEDDDYDFEDIKDSDSRIIKKKSCAGCYPTRRFTGVDFNVAFAQHLGRVVAWQAITSSGREVNVAFVGNRYIHAVLLYQIIVFGIHSVATKVTLRNDVAKTRR